MRLCARTGPGPAQVRAALAHAWDLLDAAAVVIDGEENWWPKGTGTRKWVEENVERVRRIARQSTGSAMPC